MKDAKGEVSARMLANINALAPFNSIPSEKLDHPHDITLADGENQLMHRKMLSICKKAMAEMSTQIFANPNGFAGDAALKEAFAGYFNTYLRPSIPVKPEHIIPTAGSGNAIEGLLFTLCDAGDSVLCPAPAWRGYDVYGHLKAGINVTPAYIDNNDTKPPSWWWLGSMSIPIIPALEKAYSSAPDPKRIKALLVSNPNNPFSRCWPRHVVEQMMSFAQKHDLHYISDEVFANTVFDTCGYPFASALSCLPQPSYEYQKKSQIIDIGRVHIVWSMTKDFGTCGIRSGCAMSYNKLVRDGVSYSSFWQVSSLAALFTTAVLTFPALDSWISSIKLELDSRHQLCRDILVVQELSERLLLLPATAGLWVNAIVTLRDGESMDAVVKKAKENHVIISPAHDFKHFLKKNQGEFKITFAKEEEVLRKGLERLRAALV